MNPILTRLRHTALSVLFVWPILHLLFGRAGREYGVGFGRKWQLYRQIVRNTARPGCASSLLEQVSVVTEILKIPKAAPGAVAEFGCFKGFSTATISLACALTGRKLLVFDSFAGLPSPTEAVRNMFGEAVAYHEGQFCGTLAEVKENVTRFGRIDCCEFVPGYFNRTLPARPKDETYALIFEDADLPSSIRDVLTYGWPKLRKGGVFFCHEARDLSVVRIFFDQAWWRENLQAEAPGFVGSGCGIHSWEAGCCLGYCIRPIDTENPGRG